MPWLSMRMLVHLLQVLAKISLMHQLNCPQMYIDLRTVVFASLRLNIHNYILHMRHVMKKAIHEINTNRFTSKLSDIEILYTTILCRYTCSAQISLILYMPKCIHMSTYTLLCPSTHGRPRSSHSLRSNPSCISHASVFQPHGCCVFGI